MHWSECSSGSFVSRFIDHAGIVVVIVDENVFVFLFSLRDDNQISDMLSVIISEPTETANDMERFKNANTVCEILTYENNPFADIIVSNEKFMSQLWSFVSVDSSAESPESEQASGTLSLNPLLASFFTKVYLHLFTHKTDQVMDFLARQEAPNDLVSVILRHINTSAIMDLIYKSWEYINMDTKNGTENITKYTEVSKGMHGNLQN